MRTQEEQEAWTLDQLAKSEFFHSKLHEWGMLNIAKQIDKAKGETLEWDLESLGISQKAWSKSIHRGIKPNVIQNTEGRICTIILKPFHKSLG